MKYIDRLREVIANEEKLISDGGLSEKELKDCKAFLKGLHYHLEQELGK